MNLYSKTTSDLQVHRQNLSYHTKVLKGTQLAETRAKRGHPLVTIKKKIILEPQLALPLGPILATKVKHERDLPYSYRM